MLSQLHSQQREPGKALSYPELENKGQINTDRSFFHIFSPIFISLFKVTHSWILDTDYPFPLLQRHTKCNEISLNVSDLTFHQRPTGFIKFIEKMESSAWTWMTCLLCTSILMSETKVPLRCSAEPSPKEDACTDPWLVLLPEYLSRDDYL